MAMPGEGCFVAWYDLASRRGADHDHWHSHEHMIERLAILGFLQGARYRALDDGKRTCVIYQTESVETLASPAYLERLNAPTSWSQRAVGMIEGMNRTLARVASSHGAGLGGYLMTAQLSPEPGQAETLRNWLADDAMPTLAGQAGLNAAHLLIADADASALPTEEKAIRRAPDEVADWVLLVEGYDQAAAEQALASLNGAGGLIDHGATAGSGFGLYTLDFALSGTEAKALWRPPG